MALNEMTIRERAKVLSQKDFRSLEPHGIRINSKKANGIEGRDVFPHSHKMGGSENSSLGTAIILLLFVGQLPREYCLHRKMLTGRSLMPPP